MTQSEFFPPHQGLRLGELAAALGAELADASHADRLIRNVAPIYRAKQGDLCYILSRRARDEFASCEASAVLCDRALASLVPDGIAVLISKHPHGAFAKAGALFHPQAMKAVTAVDHEGVHPRAFVADSAHLEDNVTIEPFAVIGEGAQIGSGTHIGAGTTIGRGVKIGRNCSIASGVTILCSYLGDRVIIHNGARIGQDGFGYAPGPRGMDKIVQIGRVIIQDDVEIGANTTVDRGTMDDTVIGEGTKIDNQVQIAHNVQIGRHTAIVAGVGIAGSTRIGNGVQIGGASGINGHITIGDGVQIAAMSGVIASLAPGEKVGGVPARPIKDFLRDIADLASRNERKQRKGANGDE